MGGVGGPLRRYPLGFRVHGGERFWGNRPRRQKRVNEGDFRGEEQRASKHNDV